MTIYADEMFLENFVMNYIILYLTALFSRVEYKWYRVALSSVIGALYVICSYIFYFYDFHQILLKLLLSIVLIIIAFHFKKVTECAKTLFCFYLVTCFIGGVSFGLSFLLNIYTIQENGIIYVTDFPVIVVAGATLICVLFGRYLLVFLKNKMNLETYIYPIEIFIEEHKIKINAFFDSGNHATEPLSDYPVIFLAKSIFDKILPLKIIDEIEKRTYFIEENKWKKRFRLIPISTVNNDKTILPGFRSDKVVVSLSDKEYEIKNAVLVYCEGNLSKNGEYFALIGRKAL